MGRSLAPSAGASAVLVRVLALGGRDDETEQKSLWNFVTGDHPMVVGVVFDHPGPVQRFAHQAFVFLANCALKIARERERKKEKRLISVERVICHRILGRRPRAEHRQI